MTRARDNQRYKVYRAERAVFVESGPHPEYETVARIERYLRDVTASDWFAELWPDLAGRVPEVHDGRGHRSAKGGWHKVVFPRWARTRATILHELAHWITYNVHGSPSQGVAGHGIEFCTVTLHLILHTQGLATHEALRLSYVDHRVLHEPATDERPRTIREIEPIRSATQLRLAV